MLRKIIYTLIPTCLFCNFASIEEKVGQMLMPHFEGATCNADAKMLIKELHVGGIIYYGWANDLSSQNQVAQLSASLQEEAQVPLLIAIDEEGGRVSRLKDIFNPAPAPSTIQTEEEAYFYAKKTADNLKTVGINFNLAPVADIDFSDRSYGKTPQEVINQGGAAIKGYQEGNVLTCLKHFPGHGSTQVDSHYSLPIVNKSLSELEAWELQPFWNLKADAIMTAHIMLPQIDPNNCATLSPIILNHLLRNRFDGVIITDSLVMQAIADHAVSKEDTAIRAIEAGADILTLGGSRLIGNDHKFMFTPKDVRNIHKAIVQAVKNGRISEERIDASVERIMQLKAKLRQKKQIPV